MKLSIFSRKDKTAKRLAILTAVAVCIVMALAAAASAASPKWEPDTAWYDDYKNTRGTEDNPFLIGTPEELAGLAKLACEVGTWFQPGVSFKGKHILMTRDIDLQGKEWQPIGWLLNYEVVQSGFNKIPNYKGFDGTFDGGGHTVSGLNISTCENLYVHKDLKSETAGLFGYIDNEGTVKNLFVKGNVCAATCEGAGGVAAWADGVIENCATDVLVTATSSKRGYAGGIAALNGNPKGSAQGDSTPVNAMIRNCLTLGSVISTPLSFSYAGGVVGFSSWYHGEVRNCTVLSEELTAGMDAGGIFGGFNSNVTADCVSVAGKVKASSTGGIVGAYGYGYQNCYWLKETRDQPENGNLSMGFTDYGKITDRTKLPVATALFDFTEIRTVKPGEEFEITVKSYPQDADASHLTYEWTIDESKFTVLEGHGAKKLKIKVNPISESEPIYGKINVTVTGLLSHVNAGTPEEPVYVSGFDNKAELGTMVKISPFDIVIDSIAAYGDTSPLEEGETRKLGVAINPSDAHNRNVTWELTSWDGTADEGDIKYSQNSDGSLSVKLLRGHEQEGTYTFTVTAEDGGQSDSITLTTAKVKDVDINGVIPTGDAVPSYVEGAKPSGARADKVDDISEATGSDPSDYRSNEDGVLFISNERLSEAAEDVDDKENVSIERVKPFPVIRARTVAPGKIAAMAVEVEGDALLAEEPQDVKIIQTNPDGTGELYTYAEDTDAIGNRRFLIINGDDEIMAPDEEIDESTVYKLVLYVTDNGTADLSPYEREIITAFATVTLEEKQSGGETVNYKDASSGCNGGFGALMLIALLPLMTLPRKKK